MTAARPLLGGREVRRLLAVHGLHPSRQRGQNFVTDPNTVRRIVADAGVRSGDTVVEVGPGLGSLTLGLVQAGARVHAIEVDHGMTAALAQVLGPELLGTQVDLVVADALEVRYRDVVGEARAAMVANLPYNVATPVLLTALREGVLTGYHLMVQREVGQRWVAGPGDPSYGAVSVKIALLARAGIVRSVSRQAFFPVPNVESVTVTVTPHDRRPDDVGKIMDLVDAGFAQRRKLLRNALAVAGRVPADVDVLLAAAELAPTCRAEELGVDDWIRLAANT